MKIPIALLLSSVSAVFAASDEIVAAVAGAGLHSVAFVESHIGQDFSMSELEDFIDVYYQKGAVIADSLLPDSEIKVFSNRDSSCYISPSDFLADDN